MDQKLRGTSYLPRVFLHSLSEPQKQLFCEAALALIHADHVVHERERDVREALMREMWLTAFPSEVRPVDELIPDLKRLAGKPEARIVLIELAGVALADGELHASELGWLRQAAEALAISDDELGRFCDFAASAAEIAAEGRMLVFEPENTSAA